MNYENDDSQKRKGGAPAPPKILLVGLPPLLHNFPPTKLSVPEHEVLFQQFFGLAAFREQSHHAHFQGCVAPVVFRLPESPDPKFAFGGVNFSVLSAIRVLQFFYQEIPVKAFLVG